MERRVELEVYLACSMLAPRFLPCIFCLCSRFSTRLPVQVVEDLAEGAAKGGSLVFWVEVADAPVQDVDALVLRAILDVGSRVEGPACVVGRNGEEVDGGNVAGTKRWLTLTTDKSSKDKVRHLARVAVLAVAINNDRRVGVIGDEGLELGEGRDGRAARVRVEVEVANRGGAVIKLAHVVARTFLRHGVLAEVVERAELEGRAAWIAEPLVGGHVDRSLQDASAHRTSQVAALDTLTGAAAAMALVHRCDDDGGGWWVVVLIARGDGGCSTGLCVGVWEMEERRR